MSNQNAEPVNQPQAAPRKSGAAQALLITVLAIVAFVACSYAMEGDGSASSQCKDLVREKIATGHANFTEVTFVKDDFVKGRVGAYKSGNEETVSHWECSVKSGEPEITFQHP